MFPGFLMITFCLTLVVTFQGHASFDNGTLICSSQYLKKTKLFTFTYDLDSKWFDHFNIVVQY